MSGSSSFDESIPVLTEVVQEHEAMPAEDFDDIPVLAPEDAIHVPRVPAAPAPPAVSDPLAAQEVQDAQAVHAAPPAPPAATPASRAAALDDDAWQALEERLVARVLDRLQDRVALVLEDQVRASMAPVLDRVVATLALELHEGLRQTVEQVVVRAVAQELAHLKARTS